MKKFGFIILGAIIVATLGACQTIPYEQRVANYETDIRTKFYGKSIDELILAFGPPDSSYDLTDGRKVVQYSKEENYTTGGNSYMTYESVYRGTRIHTRPDGSTKAVPIYDSIPVWRTDPVYNVNKKCVRRFVLNKDKLVEDFKWEGNACFN